MTKEVLQQALEALEAVNLSLVCEMAHHSKKDQHGIGQKCPLEIRFLETITAIKAALAQRPWVGLTEEYLAQIDTEEIYGVVGNHMAIAMAVEAMLKEKNHG